MRRVPALLLLGGVVYAAFASDCDDNPYRGIVAGVSTTTHSITINRRDNSHQIHRSDDFCLVRSSAPVPK